MERGDEAELSVGEDFGNVDPVEALDGPAVDEEEENDHRHGGVCLLYVDHQGEKPKDDSNHKLPSEIQPSPAELKHYVSRTQSAEESTDSDDLRRRIPGDLTFSWNGFVHHSNKSI